MFICPYTLTAVKLNFYHSLYYNYCPHGCHQQAQAVSADRDHASYSVSRCHKQAQAVSADRDRASYSVSRCHKQPQAVSADRDRASCSVSRCHKQAQAVSADRDRASCSVSRNPCKCLLLFLSTEDNVLLCRGFSSGNNIFMFFLGDENFMIIINNFLQIMFFSLCTASVSVSKAPQSLMNLLSINLLITRDWMFVLQILTVTATRQLPLGRHSDTSEATNPSQRHFSCQ